eukprot:760103-Hanusia_phi.AAC.3
MPERENDTRSSISESQGDEMSESYISLPSWNKSWTPLIYSSQLLQRPSASTSFNQCLLLATSLLPRFFFDVSPRP